MGVEKNSYFKYTESRAQSGYRAAILVKKQDETKYSLLVASETVPSVFGTQDSFEFDLLNSPTKGKVAGKMTLDDKEVQVLHHRDNVWRFEQLKDQTLDFMYVDSQFVGYKFIGTLSYRVNDATADILRGTYTISPMSADPTPIFDARPEIIETLCFGNAIPETVKADESFSLSVAQDVTATYKYFPITNNVAGAETTLIAEDDGLYKISESGLYGITVSEASGNYAPCTTTIYVEPAL